MTTQHFQLNPEYKPKIIYAMTAPSGTCEEFDGFRAMFTEALNSALKDVFKNEYTRSLEGSWGDEEFDSFCWDHFEEIATESGYTVSKVVR